MITCNVCGEKLAVLREDESGKCPGCKDVYTAEICSGLPSLDGKRKEITKFCGWLDNGQSITDTSEEAVKVFLRDAAKPGYKVAIDPAGAIDANPMTPLYTCGQESVRKVLKNGVEIWPVNMENKQTF